ncbi:SpoIIE family protein phosphatase, partial [Streptomyces sp. NPDC058734]|uniref:SpoIIE family protein phosphatase n=1 Tax=Streptomyces sp. NPDC058734 TaxID=3346615 RepID=UPI0036C46B85
TPTPHPPGQAPHPTDHHDLELHDGAPPELYTDGLVETRDQDIDTRLLTLTDLLAGPHRPIEETCDLLLSALRRPDTHDDVALLVARALG